MVTFEEYLREHYSPETLKRYVHQIGLYLENIDAEKVTYRELINYLGYLRSRKYSVNTINRILSTLQVYHEYLVKTGKREDNPCIHLTVRDVKHPVALHKLFSEEELSELFYREDHYESSVLRNRAIIGLLIYQALSVYEIVALKVGDLDLFGGVIQIKGSYRREQRSLALRSDQILNFERYLTSDRPRLLGGKPSTDSLFLSLRGKPMINQEIQNFVSSYQWKYSDRKITATLIRQSVLVNKLKKEDISRVRYFSGHKKISSLERYKTGDLSSLQSNLDKYYPLK